MDSARFDAFVRRFGRGVPRREVMAGAVSGALAALLGSTGAGAVSTAPQADLATTQDPLYASRRLAAEKKRKKRKKKGKGGKPAPNNPGPNTPDPNLPQECTATACPLPPECSQQALDACAQPLIAALAEDAQACKEPCQDRESVACQECVDPLVTQYQADVLACAEESCGRSFGSGDGGAPRDSRRGEVTAERWWARTCDKPCCFQALNACQQDATEESLFCTAAAVIATALSGPGGAVALGFCLSKLVYALTRCDSRQGCESRAVCLSDNTCCDDTPCGDLCCSPGTICTSGTVYGRPRHACCDPSLKPEEDTLACDGYCCSGHNLQCCRPDFANPCLC